MNKKIDRSQPCVRTRIPPRSPADSGSGNRPEAKSESISQATPVRARNSSPTRSSDYQVGYAKPPKSTRFKPGQSGNPKGRKKGSKNTATVLQNELSKTIPIRENGVTRKRSKRQVAIAQTVNKAVSGNLPAFKQIVEMENRYNTDPQISPSTHSGESGPHEPELSEADKYILAAFKAEVLEEAMAQESGDD